MKSNSIKLGAYDAEVYEELSVPEVFADLFNGAVFGGQEIIRTGLREVFELLGVMGNSEELESLFEAPGGALQLPGAGPGQLIGTFLNVPELKKRAEMAGKRKENVDMCTAIREMLSRSREEGMQQSVRQIIQNMISQKYTDQQILEICGITPQYLASIKKETKEL